MKRKTAGFLFLLAAGVVALLYFIVSRPYDRQFVCFNLLEQFWIPALGALLALLIGGMLLCRHRRRTAAGKKAGFSAFMTGLLMVLAVLQTALAVWRLVQSPDYCRLTKLPSPGSEHSIYRYRRSDVFGNSCYVFVYKLDAFTACRLFDADETDPQIVWDGEYVTFRGTTYHLTDKEIACS